MSIETNLLSPADLSATVPSAIDSGIGAQSCLPQIKDIFNFISTPDNRLSSKELSGRVSSLLGALPALQLQHTQLQTVDALVDNHLDAKESPIDYLAPLSTSTLKFSRNTPTKKSSADYLDLATFDKNHTEEKALAAVALDGGLIEGYKAAHNFLRYPAALTQDISRQFFKGKNPISDGKKIIGEGSRATVKKRRISETYCAAKCLKTNEPEALMHEYDMFTALQEGAGHPSLVKLNAVDFDNTTLYLEFASKGSLTAPIENRSLTREEFTTIAYQAASGLAYIHSKGIIHRDIKTDNILLTEDNQVKISDFGEATFKDKFNPNGSTQGSVYNLPPEYLAKKSTQENCEKIDVWSFGMLLWQQLKQDDIVTPFHSNTSSNGSYDNPHAFTYHMTRRFKGFQEGQLEATLDTENEVDDETGKVLKSFLNYYDPNRTLLGVMKRCLAYNPEDRPSMEEVTAILARDATQSLG